MNKDDLLNAYIASLEKTIGDVKSSLRTIRTDIDDSPAPTQSHSDTTRSRLSGVESEISRRLATLKETRNMADSIFSRNIDCIALGALIEIMDVDTGDEEYYFIVPGQGGEILSVDGIEVISVSMNAPILESISGIEVGSTVEFRSRKLALLDIS